MVDSRPALLFSTGSPAVDSQLREVIARLEAALPGRVRGYYLGGSYADGSAVAASDVDVYIVLRGAVSDADAQALAAIRNRLDQRRRRFDLTLRGEDQVLRDGSVGFKLSGRLLHGEEIRDRIALQPLEPYLADVARGCTIYMLILRADPPELPAVLAYPDPDGEFFGYERHGILQAEGWAPGTRTLLNCVTLGGSWFLGRASGVQVGSKAASVRAYVDHVGDEWSAWVARVFQRCKLDWGYQLPTGASERAELRELCRRALVFENRLLEDIRGFTAQ